MHWKSANLLSPPPKKRLTGVDLVFSRITVTFLIFQKNPGLIYGLSIWISINIILLLLLSFPAFQLTEEGENITNSAFNMYQNSLKREDDPRISVIIDYWCKFHIFQTKMLILISQVHSNHITISAYNYFPLSRGILLTVGFPRFLR